MQVFVTCHLKSHDNLLPDPHLSLVIQSYPFFHACSVYFYHLFCLWRSPWSLVSSFPHRPFISLIEQHKHSFQNHLIIRLSFALSAGSSCTDLHMIGHTHMEGPLGILYSNSRNNEDKQPKIIYLFLYLLYKGMLRENIGVNRISDSTYLSNWVAPPLDNSIAIKMHRLH